MTSLASPETLETCPCPLCSSDRRTTPAFRFPPYAVVRCRDCGLWYLSPRLREEQMLVTYRDEGYFDPQPEDAGSGTEDAGYGSYRLQEQALRATFRALLRRLERRGMTGGALLDVGCAYGYLLDEARPFFSRRVGVEMAPEALRHARGFADRVFEGGLEAVEGGPFDLVIAVQVIEHIYDPVPFVEQAAAMLAPGGCLVLATPHMGSLWRPIFGRRWPSFKIPEHVTYFDRRTLGELLRRGGLGEVRPLPYPHAFPLALVASKLGLPAPGWLAGRRLWIPGTTLALAARKER